MDALARGEVEEAGMQTLVIGEVCSDGNGEDVVVGAEGREQRELCADLFCFSEKEKC